MSKLHDRSPSRERIVQLFCASADGWIDEQDHKELAELLRSDPAAREIFIEQAMLHSLLFHKAKQSEEQAGLGIQSSESNSPSPIPNPLPFPPIVTDPTPILHSPVGSYIFSHIAAAVILGIGLLVGLAWRISLPSSEGPAPDTIAQSVAHITALADCKWTKQGAEKRGEGRGERGETQISKSSNPQIPVFLGDRFSVSSGLMQITYDTGAVVLLQGPCTYEIDSTRGGYLAVGKLTALVETGGGGRGTGEVTSNSDIHNPKSPASCPQSLIPNPLFAVRTPTAVVTDLGTEFGVEVEQSGATRSHVFQGSVSIVPSPSGRGARGEGDRKPAEILHVGESVRVERGRNSQVAITRELGQPNRFVRKISKSPSPEISKSSNPQSLIPNPSYRLNDLGTLGGHASRANAINVVGQIVGEATTIGGDRHAFLYDHGKMQDLNAPGEGNSSANSINAAGEIAGDQYTGHDRGPVAFLYSNGRKRMLGTLGGQMSRSYSMNDAGTIVGCSRNGQGVTRAFRCARGQTMEDLGALGGASANSYAIDINANGLIAGYSETTKRMTRAVVFNAPDGIKDLGTLAGRRSWAYGVNNDDRIIGFSLGDDHRIHAVQYVPGQKPMDLLDICAFGELGELGFCINNAGQVVGSARTNMRGVTETRSFLYSHGKIHDLLSLVESNTGWSDLITTAINDSGQIVGVGRAPDKHVRAFLMTPITDK